MTDIVGSTEHASELGDAGWRELVQQHHALIRAALRRHRGREMDTAGDGFFAIFDAPATAVACALEIAEAVGKLGVEIRAGIHVGEVEQVGSKVAGISVPIASRIMAGAEPGEVLVSSTVRDLVAGSGLTFTDRGVRELKGVPGEWHVYTVGRAEADTAGAADAAASARDRRASAVRRAGSRPIWQRRSRLVAAAVVALAVILATSGLLIWKPWQPAALATVKENSIGIIDPSRSEVIGEIPVGTRPGGIAVGEGYAWITNTGDDTVSKIDLHSRSIVVRIDVGRAPKGIAVAAGSVWVANSGERTVSRINAAAERVVDNIEVGNGPTAIVAAGGLLWVANALDSTLVSIHSQTGAVGTPVAVATTPIALAADEGGLWLASEDGASVSHLDPATGVPRAAPVQLAGRPTAISIDEQSAWVALTDGTVTRIDRGSNRVTATIVVGGSLAAIVVSDEAVWVGDQEGNVHRLAVADPSPPERRVSTGTAVAALAAVDGSVWLAAQPSAATHRGGTLRIVDTVRIEGLASLWDPDPLGDPVRSVAYLEGDGLVGYRRIGGAAGSILLPDLATAIPQPTNGGLTYTFQLRPNLQYSTGVPVRASDFRRGLERSFQIQGPFGSFGPFLFAAIAGSEACVNEEQTPVERCDLSASVLADDTANTVTINLSHPDRDFLFKLAHQSGYPVPDGVPMNALVKGAFPGTGPYAVGEIATDEVRMVRNPHFEVWDASVRPDGFPDEIILSVVDDDAQRVEMVESGTADYTSYGGESRTSPELFARVKRQYAGQWHAGTSVTTFVAMNTSLPPFDNADVRRAFNFALDRGHLADLAGGPPDTAVTCQLLPPGFPAYQPYCPYTFNPDAGGRWKQPDMQAAQRLVDASGTRGAEIAVGPAFEFLTAELDYIGSVLETLGYKVTVDRETNFDKVVDAFATDQITINGWFPDYVAPSNFLGLFTCGGDVVINYCDADFDAAFNHALELQATDPAAALAEWAAVDRLGVDLALIAPMYNAGGDFLSARVGNYQYNSFYGVLVDQLWVQ